MEQWSTDCLEIENERGDDRHDAARERPQVTCVNHTTAREEAVKRHEQGEGECADRDGVDSSYDCADAESQKATCRACRRTPQYSNDRRGDEHLEPGSLFCGRRHATQFGAEEAPG